jgi:hypothetical protein
MQGIFTLSGIKIQNLLSSIEVGYINLSYGF